MQLVSWQSRTTYFAFLRNFFRACAKRSENEEREKSATSIQVDEARTQRSHTSHKTKARFQPDIIVEVALQHLPQNKSEPTARHRHHHR